MSEVYYDWESIGIAQSKAKLANAAIHALNTTQYALDVKQRLVEVMQRRIDAAEYQIAAGEELIAVLKEKNSMLMRRMTELVALAQEHANAFADERAALRVLLKLMKEKLSKEDYDLIMKDYQGENFIEMFRKERNMLVRGSEENKKYFGVLTSATSKEGEPEYKLHPFVSFMRNKFKHFAEYEREGRNNVHEDPRDNTGWMRDEHYNGENMIKDPKKRMGTG